MYTSEHNEILFITGRTIVQNKSSNEEMRGQKVHLLYQIEVRLRMGITANL